MANFSIDSPHNSELYCMAPDDTLPIGGECVDVSQVWVLVTGGTCSGISTNPYTAGASEVGGGTGPWSGGTLLGSDLGPHCVAVYWLLEGESNIQCSFLAFEIAAVGGPSCPYSTDVVMGVAASRQTAARRAGTQQQPAVVGTVPRRVRVQLQASELRLTEPLSGLLRGGALTAPPIVLEFAPQASNARRFVWLGGTRQLWRLEAVPNPGGRWRLTLTLHRIDRADVLPPLVWSRGDFCFRRGGRLRSQAHPPLPAVTVEAVR